MSILNSYKVAGFVFDVKTPDSLDIPESMSNLAPFICTDADAPRIFSLEVVEEMQTWQPELIFCSDDGPGFPEIRLFKASDGWLVRVRPLPKLKEASVMWIDGAFSNAKLQILCQEERVFALNNAMMLLYAFSTARLGALEMHSSVVTNDGKGYMFLGKSGTGKSTHSSLWLKHIPGTELLNDDNPILRMMPDGTAIVFGSPWSGKTPCYKAKEAPVGAIVRIRQAPENAIQRLPLVQAYASIMSSASSFRPFSDLAEGWHRTIEALVSSVPCYTLDCLPDQGAAELCFKTVNG